MLRNLESLTRDSYSAADCLNHDGGDPVILLAPSCWEKDTEYWKTVGGTSKEQSLAGAAGLAPIEVRSATKLAVVVGVSSISPESWVPNGEPDVFRGNIP